MRIEICFVREGYRLAHIGAHRSRGVQQHLLIFLPVILVFPVRQCAHVSYSFYKSRTKDERERVCVPSYTFDMSIL